LLSRRCAGTAPSARPRQPGAPARHAAGSPDQPLDRHRSLPGSVGVVPTPSRGKSPTPGARLVHCLTRTLTVD
jgi:hypothetical protein